MTYSWKLTKLRNKLDGDFNSPIVNFPFIYGKIQQQLYIESISPSLYDIPDVVVPTIISWYRVAAKKESKEPSVLSGLIEVMT